MIIKKLYELRIIKTSIEQEEAIRNFLKSLKVVYYYDEGEDEFCIEHLEKQEYAKISKFLKTL